MPLSIRADPVSDVLHVRFDGEVCTDQLWRALEETDLHFKREGFTRVLLDLSHPTIAVGLSDVYEFIGCLPAAFKVAKLLNVNRAGWIDCTLVDTIAFNRGKSYRVFFSEREALAWLTADRAEPDRATRLRPLLGM